MTASIKDMRIDHGRTDVPMPEEFLDGSDIVAFFHEIRGERMAQGVLARRFVNPYVVLCLLHRLVHGYWHEESAESLESLCVVLW
jgi:hypothetical protein